MKYYKIFVNSEYIGVASSKKFRRYQEMYGILIICDNIADVEYIQHEETFYHDEWMKVSSPSGEYNCVNANVVEITEEEYNILNNANENKEIVAQILEPQKIEEPEEIEPFELSYVKEAKINKLRIDCQNAIISGFDLEFADNSIHHFSMEITDQIELQRLVMDKSDMPIPYHADGDIFRYYTYQDIVKIYDTMNDWKLYHTVYFSDLKRYVNSMNSIKEIDEIEYGCDIPDNYQSEIYKDIKAKLDV